MQIFARLSTPSVSIFVLFKLVIFLVFQINSHVGFRSVDSRDCFCLRALKWSSRRCEREERVWLRHKFASRVSGASLLSVALSRLYAVRRFNFTHRRFHSLVFVDECSELWYLADDHVSFVFDYCCSKEISDPSSPSRSTRETSDSGRRFKFYCAYVFGMLGGVFVVIAVPIASLFDIFIISWLFVFSFAAIMTADLIFFTWSAINLLKLSRSTNVTDHKWFEDQKRRQEWHFSLVDALNFFFRYRFWFYLQLFVISLITSVIQMHSWMLYDEYNAIIVADATVCFSTLLILLIVLTRTETRKAFTERYDQLRHNRL